MDMTVVCMDTDQVFHEEYRVLKMVVKHQAASRALLVPVAESEANTSISIPTHHMANVSLLNMAVLTLHDPSAIQFHETVEQTL